MIVAAAAVVTMVMMVFMAAIAVMAMVMMIVAATITVVTVVVMVCVAICDGAPTVFVEYHADLIYDEHFLFFACCFIRCFFIASGKRKEKGKCH